MHCKSLWVKQCIRLNGNIDSWNDNNRCSVENEDMVLFVGVDREFV